MGAYRRINVASGRPLEKLAHYSRALRAGDTVLQSGTTAIDREGNVRGVGDVARQVDAIMRIAEWSMGRAGGRLEDVVRSRIYVTDISLADQAARAHAKYFRDARPVSTLVQVERPGPAGATRSRSSSTRWTAPGDGGSGSPPGRAIENEYAYSRAVRVGDRVFIAGTTALNPQGAVEGPGDMYRQTRATMETILRALAEAGGTPRRSRLHEDLPDRSRADGRLHAGLAGGARRRSARVDLARYPRAWCAPRCSSRSRPRPSSAPPDTAGHLHRAPAGEAARLRARRGDRRPGLRQRLHVDEPGERDRGAWATGRPSPTWPHRAIGWALAQAGATLDDVIRRRTFTVEGAHVNRPHGEGPAWFAGSHPASLGCRIAGLARPELLVEIEVAALKGAGHGIEWIAPDRRTRWMAGRQRVLTSPSGRIYRSSLGRFLLDGSARPF